VRIEVPADVAAKQMLRPGMSVVVSVNTKPVKSATKTALAGEGAATLR
jgi:multidrug resistance efflux pump